MCTKCDEKIGPISLDTRDHDICRWKSRYWIPVVLKVAQIYNLTSNEQSTLVIQGNIIQTNTKMDLVWREKKKHKTQCTVVPLLGGHPFCNEKVAL